MSFPWEIIEEAIRDEIAAAAADCPASKGAWEPEVDSHVMVRLVCRIEEETGLNLPDDCMPPGGFKSIDHCVAVLLAASQKLWVEEKEMTE